MTLNTRPTANETALTPRLSSRIEALLSLLEPCGLLADVGTDHAFVPAHAVRRGLAERALAVDLRVEPLRAAERNLSALGVADRVDLVRGDGLLSLVGTGAEVVVLAGLSGATFVRWLLAAPEVPPTLKRLVVQPNGKASSVRQHAYEHGLHLVDESIVVDGGRHFITCAFAPGASPDPAYTRSALSLEQAFELGPWLFERRQGLDYYAAQVRRLSALSRSDDDLERMLRIYQRGLAE